MPAQPLDRVRSALQEGRYAAALSILDGGIPSELAVSIGVAEALCETGAHQAALTALAALEATSTAASVASAAIARLRGIVLLEQGKRSDGADQLRLAVSIAEAAGFSEEGAKAALRLFTHVHSSAGAARSTEVLETAKRLVLRTAKAGLLADLHYRVGQAEAQSGNLKAASRHLDRALELLAAHPHYAVEAKTKLALSSTLTLLSRNDEAVALARDALTAAEQSGCPPLTRLIQANLSQLQFRTGDLAAATSTAKALLVEGQIGGILRVAVLETLIAAANEQGTFVDCAQHLREFVEAMRSEDEPSWIAVEAVPTQARVLERTEGPASAFAALRIGIERSQLRGHHDNAVRLLLLEAELAARTGDTELAERSVSTATASLSQNVNIEIVALIERARGLVAARWGGRSSAEAHLKRSERIFKGCHLRVESRRSRHLRHETRSWPGSDKFRSGLGSLSSLADIEALQSLVSHPRLLAKECGLSIRRLRLATDVGFGVVPASAPSVDVLARRTIFCGADDSGRWVVSFKPMGSYVATQRLAHLFRAIEAAVSQNELERQRRSFVGFFEVAEPAEGTQGVYVSTVMRQLLSMIRRVAPSDLPILIAGETGTGKEIVAREVHELSRRAQQPFIAFNVSAVPADMLEGQLFGYKRGAFTGAVSDAKGLIREAEGGTLFIDEIGELSLDLQPKLLRFLESGEIQPLGERPQRVDVRIVAATNARLEELVRQGRFRDDLYYRLNIVPLTIPPLRDRREEIPTLVHYFLTRHARDAGKPIPQLTPQALDCLSAYDWPGNVRQLTNELKRVVALSQDDELVDTIHLAPGIRHAPVPDTAPSRHDPAALTINLDRPLQQLTDDIERAAISRALERAGQNFADGARLLGITRKGLYLKRRRLGLDQLEPSDEEV